MENGLLILLAYLFVAAVMVFYRLTTDSQRDKWGQHLLAWIVVLGSIIAVIETLPYLFQCMAGAFG